MRCSAADGADRWVLLRKGRRGVQACQSRTAVHASPHGHDDGAADGRREEAGAADYRVNARRRPGKSRTEETDHRLSAARYGRGQSEDWMEGAGARLHQPVREHLYGGRARRNYYVLQVAGRAEDDREDAGTDDQEHADYAAEDGRVAAAAQPDGAGFHEADGGNDREAFVNADSAAGKERARTEIAEVPCCGPMKRLHLALA